MLKLIIFRLPQRPAGTRAMRAFATWESAADAAPPAVRIVSPGAADTSEDEP